MTTSVVSSPGTKGGGRRERAGVFALAGVIITIVVVYIALNSAKSSSGGDGSRGLLPYQTLAGTLPASDRRQFRTLRTQLLAAETQRVQTKRWPDADALALPGPGYRWVRIERGVVTNYLGLPTDPAQAAWLIEIQEPEPGVPPDPAPNDEEHHRLSDGTTLHTYIWMHHFGGQIAAGFVPQPQNTGWVELFTTVPNPGYAIRR